MIGNKMTTQMGLVIAPTIALLTLDMRLVIVGAKVTADVDSTPSADLMLVGLSKMSLLSTCGREVDPTRLTVMMARGVEQMVFIVRVLIEAPSATRVSGIVRY
jgi:hypothetical protein